MTYVVLDFETTGLNFTEEQVIEVSAIKLNEKLEEIGAFNTFVKLHTGRSLPPFITELTGITEDDLKHGMNEYEAMEVLEHFIGDSTVVAQYAPFDLAYLSNYGIEPKRFICTKSLTSQAEPNENSSLGATCERLGIDLTNAHRAIDDARATADLLKYRFNQVDEIPYFFNALTVTEGRALNFIPKNTKHITIKGGGLIADFSKVKGVFE